MFLRVFAHWEQPAALPTADQENGCRTRIRFVENPPRFEVCGGAGWTTSETVGSGLTPCTLAPRRSGSAGKHISDPGQRDHRTHAGNPAAGCSAVSVHSRPSGQGAHRPMLYHTDLTTNQYRDSRRQAIVHYSPFPVISRVCGSTSA